MLAKIFTTAALVIFSNAVVSQELNIYSEANYPLSGYSTSKTVFDFSDFQVELIQLSSKGQKDANSIFCRTWLNIISEGQLKDQAFYKNIEAVGGCSGVYTPAIQPVDGYFLASKFGDYNGQVIILNRQGILEEFIGGKFFISNDKKYLFSNHDSDLSGLTVFDLDKSELLFESELDKYLADWYYSNDRYYVVVSEDYTDGETIEILEFDVETKKIELKKVSINSIKEQDRLTSYNDMLSARECNCK